MTAETRSKLLALARAMFGDRGYADTSMDELTSAAGMTRGALYHHFESKNGLFQAVVDEIERELDANVTARLKLFGAAVDDGWAKLRVSCRCYLETVLDPQIQRIMLKDAPNVYPDFASRPTRLHCLKATTQALADLIEKGEASGTDARAATQMLTGAMGALAQWASDPANGPDRLAMAENLLDGILRGLRTPAKAAA